MAMWPFGKKKEEVPPEEDEHKPDLKEQIAALLEEEGGHGDHDEHGHEHGHEGDGDGEEEEKIHVPKIFAGVAIGLVLTAVVVVVGLYFAPRLKNSATEAFSFTAQQEPSIAISPEVTDLAGDGSILAYPLFPRAEATGERGFLTPAMQDVGCSPLDSGREYLVARFLKKENTVAFRDPISGEACFFYTSGFLWATVNGTQISPVKLGAEDAVEFVQAFERVSARTTSSRLSWQTLEGKYLYGLIFAFWAVTFAQFAMKKQLLTGLFLPLAITRMAFVLPLIKGEWITFYFAGLLLSILGSGLEAKRDLAEDLLESGGGTLSRRLKYRAAKISLGWNPLVLQEWGSGTIWIVAVSLVTLSTGWNPTAEIFGSQVQYGMAANLLMLLPIVILESMRRFAMAHDNKIADVVSLLLTAVAAGGIYYVVFSTPLEFISKASIILLIILLAGLVAAGFADKGGKMETGADTAQSTVSIAFGLLLFILL